MRSFRFVHGSTVPLAALVAALTLVPAARGQDGGWPRRFDSASGMFVVYQPQPEDLRRDVLSARAAFSIQKRGEDNPTFGVLWFQARIEVDRDSSVVTERGLDVTRVRMPGISDADARRYENAVEDEARSWDLSGSLDELKEGLAASAKERASVENLDQAPPHILFVKHRALLVNYDGPPVLEPIERSSLQRVTNTAYAVVYDPARKTYYLSGSNLWYRATDPLGHWTPIDAPPAAVRDVVPPDTSSVDQLAGSPPEVLTATEPTELIATDGEPLLAPLTGDQLLYVTNTENDVLRYVPTQAIYVLLSGRWYTAQSENGPWTFVAPDQLPDEFRRIPADSPKGHLLASVEGTLEADDAVADAEIPQTSAISRDDHSAAVDWDGDPQFDDIEGTGLRYGVNTDSQVLFDDGEYYLCDQGVWYVSGSAYGPWSVSDRVPSGLDDIPPDCPVYNVRWCEIYEVTPDVVYCGYRPGYLGFYPYHGCVVYGTGYRYHPWRRHHYYPRPVTWGYHACYNPWVDRWSFGFSWWSGFLHVGTQWRPHVAASPRHRVPMWFGPGGFHRPWLGEDREPVRTRPPSRRLRVPDRAPINLYTRNENAPRMLKTRDLRLPVRPVTPQPANVPNDVYAGRDGKVYRRAQGGDWRVHDGRNWVPAQVPQAPAPRTPIPVEPKYGTDRPSPPSPPPTARPGTTPQPRTERPQWTPRQPQSTPQPAQPARQPETPRYQQPPAAPTPVRGTLEREFQARERARAQAPTPAQRQEQRQAPQEKGKQTERPRRDR